MGRMPRWRRRQQAQSEISDLSSSESDEFEVDRFLEELSSDSDSDAATSDSDGESDGESSSYDTWRAIPTISHPGAALQALDELDDWRAHNLASTIRGPEAQLKELQNDRDALQRKFEAEIRVTIESGLQSLQLFVEHVARVDRSILFWHKKAAPLRITLKVLKPIGFDLDAMTIKTKKGNVIKKQADDNSLAFGQCSDICQASLGKVQDLHVRANNFVQVGIVGAQNEAQDVVCDYERKKQDLQVSIDEKGLDVAGVEFQASRARQRVNDLEEQQDRALEAAESSRKLGVAGVASSFLLGASCLLFPPAGAVVAGLGAVAAGAVGVSSAVVSRHVSSKTGYDDAIQRINVLEESCKQLRDQTNLFLKEINAARLALSRGVTKTQGIAAALERCEYARTRKDFVSRVTGVLEDLRGGSQLVSQRPQLAAVPGKLGTLQKTDGVVSIMPKCI